MTRLAQVGGFSALFLLCLPDAGVAKVASIGECPGSGGGERFDCQCSWRSAPSVSRNVKIGRSDVAGSTLVTTAIIPKPGLDEPQGGVEIAMCAGKPLHVW